MKSIISILFTLVFLLGACKNSTNLRDRKEITAEVNTFMDHYADLLKNREMEKISDLYYDSGIVFSGDGYSEFSPFDSIRSLYLRQPRNPIYFKWTEIKVDLLSSDVALITSKFYWNNRGEKDTTRFSYTGILLRTPKGWKIKHEHESTK